VRAALCTEPFAAEKSRSHNNANILVLGGRVTGPDLAVEIVKTWLKPRLTADATSSGWTCLIVS
jgi:ribose 5-phosphate isomerase B